MCWQMKIKQAVCDDCEKPAVGISFLSGSLVPDVTRRWCAKHAPGKVRTVSFRRPPFIPNGWAGIPPVKRQPLKVWVIEGTDKAPTLSRSE